MTPFYLNWDEIDDVLLDMDGTLLDRHFDNFFSKRSCRGAMLCCTG